MGTDCAPFLANLFLHYYEYSYVKSNIYSNPYICRKLSHTFRYIDDITVINDEGIFDKVYKDIYPDSLQLVKINSNSSIANVLDINISIVSNKFVTDVYDKRVDFAFEIVNFPHNQSNISVSVCKNVISSQILK